MRKIRMFMFYNTGRWYIRSGNIEDLEKYYTERFEIFKQTFAQSIKHQTDKDFEWIIFTNKKSEFFEDFKQFCDNIHNQIIYVHVSYLESSKEEVDAFVTEYAKEHYNEHLIDCRYDSDDMIGRHYIETIRKLPLRHDAVFYSSESFLYHYDDKYLVKCSPEKKNFPLILRDKANQHRSIFEYEHLQWKHMGWEYEVAEGIPFVYNVHDFNWTILNKENGWENRFTSNNGNIVKNVKFSDEEKAYIQDEFPWLSLKWFNLRK